MMMIVVIACQALSIFFIGIFARTNDPQTLSNLGETLINSIMAILFGFTLMYCPFRKLSIFAFVNMLLTISITVQTAILFATFWDNCFNSFDTLNPYFQITSRLLAKSGYACLAILITGLDFIGLFSFWQVYLLIAPIMTIGYCLNSSIIIYGLKAFDGGGGLSIFLYSGVCSLMIWIMCIRGKMDHDRLRIKQSYINKTLGFIGVVISYINWPKFNAIGAIMTYLNVNKTTNTWITVLPSQFQLQYTGYLNTFIGLSAPLLLSFLFVSKETKDEKLKYEIYIDSFINGGIVIASYQDITLNPMACLVMTSLSTIVTLVIHKYFLTPSQTQAEGIFKRFMVNYSKVMFRIIFSVLGIVIASIVVAARKGTTPELLYDNYSKIAGFQMVAMIITIILGAIFGLLTAVSINIFLSFNKNPNKSKQQEVEQSQSLLEINDQTFFQSFYHNDIYPLYYDIFETINKKQQEKINIAEYTTRIIKQSLLSAQKSPLRMHATNQNIETKMNPQNLRFFMDSDFSKLKSNVEVSKMKSSKKYYDESLQSNRQDQLVVNPHEEMVVQKSHLKIIEGSEQSQQNNKNVIRKLSYDDGSEILEQNVNICKVKH